MEIGDTVKWNKLYLKKIINNKQRAFQRSRIFIIVDIRDDEIYINDEYGEGSTLEKYLEKTK